MKVTIKYFLSLTFINILTIYLPVLNFLKKNDILKQYYGLRPKSFFIILLFVAALPYLLYICTRFIKSSQEKSFKLIFVLYILLYTLGMLTSIGLMKGIIPALLIGLFLHYGSKRLDNAIWVMSILAVIIIADAGYKTLRAFNSHFPFGWYSYNKYDSHIKKFKLKTSAPKNIIMILIDGTDLTSNYLDSKHLPELKVLPNLHKLSQESFTFYPMARTNSPQTFVSVPILFSGMRYSPTAFQYFKEGRSIIHALREHYTNTKLFAYRNYYQSICEPFPDNCYPFKEKNSEKELYKIAWKIFWYNHSFKLVPLPFKLGKDFEPEHEEFDIQTVLSEFNRLDINSNNFYLMHIFRRSKKKLQQFDQELSKITQMLKDKNVFNDSLIVIFSDHGIDHTQKEYKYGFKSSQNEKILRVPIFLSYPRLINAGVNKNLVENVDIFKTIMDITFEEHSFISDGQSLLSKSYKPVTKKFYNCTKKGKLIGTKNNSKFQLENCY